jgi:dTMP kinase
MSRGVFITFEGGEGVGKTTLINGIKSHFEAQNREIIFTREPGGSPLAEALRNLLLTGENEAHHGMSVETEALIICAARSDHVDNVILPALKRGALVFCDRFSDSTRAYQGDRISHDSIERMISVATKGLSPDMTFLLDGDPLVFEKRRRERKGVSDRFERRDIRFHVDVRERFLAIAALEPERFAIIDAEATPETILYGALDILKERLGLEPSMDKVTD